MGTWTLPQCSPPAAAFFAITFARPPPFPYPSSPDVLRPGMVGMLGPMVMHTTTAMHDDEYTPHPPSVGATRYRALLLRFMGSFYFAR